MESVSYILPWIFILLAIGLGFATKFLPFKSIAGAAVMSLLMLFMIGVAIYDIILLGDYEEAIAERDKSLQDMEEWKYKHMDEMSLLLARQNNPTDEQLAQLKQLMGFGWISSNPAITRPFAAHQAREILKSDLPPVERAKYLLKGIPKSVDETIVDLGMRELGYIVVPYREDEPILDDVNVIYYGRDVDLLTLKLTALTLMQAGVDLKEVKPFQQPTKGNLRAVKLDWNKYFEARPTLSAQQVVEAADFK